MKGILKHAMMVVGVAGCLSACSPLRMPVKDQYKLMVSHSPKVSKKTAHSILMTSPEAVAGYQTEQMIYIKKPYELNSFVHSSWVSSPPNMLYPLMIESLQNTHYFSAVMSGAYAGQAEYRLDTLILSFQQNFLKHPSVFNFRAKVTLTHVDDARVVASEMISLNIPCQEDTPYGGVVAANQASARFTSMVSKFVIKHIADRN